MNPLDFLNQNPALTSLIAFPLGLLMLLITAKQAGLGKLYTDTLGAIKAHTAAEIKIEERLCDVLTELKNVTASQWDNRRYIDEKLDHFDEKFRQLLEKSDLIYSIIPKRKDDKSQTVSTQ